MDEITSKVRNMYELYPYPQAAPSIRAATCARLLLSYVGKSRSEKRPLRVLDAGCGRGVGVLASASLQPDVQFTAVDINRVALDELRVEKKRRQLHNLSIQEIDLMSLDGLDVPVGGFDVIYSSGVLHHLSNPLEGLKNLTNVLAEHGALVLMVYATYGRASLYRLRKSIDLLLPKDLPLPDCLQPGRDIAKAMDERALAPWNGMLQVGDVEFVDQALNVNEVAYDIDSMWSLLESGGLHFLRWIEPKDWSVASKLPPGTLREYAMQLDIIDQYRLVEQMSLQTSLQLIATHTNNPERPPLTKDEISQTLFAVNPDVSFIKEVRNLHGQQRIESLSVKIRTQEPQKFPNGPSSVAILLFADQNLPFLGESILAAMAEEGIDQESSQQAILELEQAEVIYRPHSSEA